MIPYTSEYTYVYNMVDMEGLDLTKVRGNVYSGLYSRILAAIGETLTVVLYNWYCAGIRIPPAYVDIIQASEKIILNNTVVINNNDTVEIPGMGTTPIIESLTVVENGTYEVSSGVDGFNPVVVSTHIPVIQSLSVYENGTYNAPSGVDGFNPVVVNTHAPVIQPLSVSENGTYEVPSGVDGYNPVSVNVISVPNLSKFGLKFNTSNPLIRAGRISNFSSYSSYVQLYGSSSAASLDFSQPFRIETSVSVSNTTDRDQVILSRTTGSQYGMPHLAITTNGGIHAAVSSQTNNWSSELTWEEQSLVGAGYVDIVLEYNGSVLSLSITVNGVTYQISTLASNLYQSVGSNFVYGIGACSALQYGYGRYISVDLAKTKIYINNALVWGVS